MRTMKNYNLDEQNAMAFLFSCEKGEPLLVKNGGVILSIIRENGHYYVL